MLEFVISLLEVSIAMSVIAFVYIAVTPLLSRIFTAKGRYYAWLVIIIGFIIPFRFHYQVSVISLDTFIPSARTPNSNFIENYTTFMSSTVQWHALVFGLWFVGMLVFITIHIIQHKQFLNMVNRWGVEVIDRQVLRMLYDIQADLRIKGQVEMKVCPGISSPMLIGFFRPTIILPMESISPDELPIIIKHELVHFKRRDVWYKLFVFLATALHWFNPLVYMIAREISIQCEISCDEEVVKNTDVNERKKYVEAIISVIRKQSNVRSQFSTTFYNGKHGLKQRVFSIMDSQNKKWGYSIVAIITVATISTNMMIKINTINSSHFVFESVNEMGLKSVGNKEKRSNNQSYINRDNTVSDEENNNLDISPKPILQMDKNEDALESDTPKLIEED